MPTRQDNCFRLGFLSFTYFLFFFFQVSNLIQAVPHIMAVLAFEVPHNSVSAPCLPLACCSVLDTGTLTGQSAAKQGSARQLGTTVASCSSRVSMFLLVNSILSRTLSAFGLLRGLSEPEAGTNLSRQLARGSPKEGIRQSTIFNHARIDQNSW